MKACLAGSEAVTLTLYNLGSVFHSLSYEESVIIVCLHFLSLVIGKQLNLTCLEIVKKWYASVKT